jgi:hypothetical protein
MNPGWILTIVVLGCFTLVSVVSEICKAFGPNNKKN